MYVLRESLAYYFRTRVREYLTLPGPVEIDETFIRIKNGYISTQDIK